MPPRLAKVLRIINGNAGLKIRHMNDAYGPGIPDVVWIPRYAQDGGRFVLSRDKKMFSTAHEKSAIQKNGLCVFLLSSSITNRGLEAQVAFVILWWPAMLEKMEEITALNPRTGLFIEIPPLVRPRIDKLREIE